MMTAGAVAAGVVLLSGGLFGKTVFAHETDQKLLKVAIQGNLMPVSVKEKGTESYKGVAPDILESFAKEQGLELIYVEADSYLDAVRLTETGVTDVLAVDVGYPNVGSSEGLRMTDAYLKAQMLLMYRKDSDLRKIAEYTAAEVAGYPVFTDNHVVRRLSFDTPEKCLHAVRSGQADLMYCDIFTGTIYMQQYDNRDLVSFPLETETWFRFGVSPEADPVLLDLLNQKIASMTRMDRNRSLSISSSAMSNGMEDMIYHHPYEIICIGFTVAFLIVVGFATYYRVHSRSRVSVQGFAESFHMLADAFGEAGLEYDYLKDRLTVFGTHGHKLWIPSRIDQFSAYLEQENPGISMTREEFEQILVRGMAGEACEAELRCKLEDGSWGHFRLIYTVVATEESYKRPIRMIGCLVSAEQLYKEREELRALGMYDRLTGLFNRSGLEWKRGEYLQRENVKRREAEARGVQVSSASPDQDVLLLIDVDEFKTFNDAYGHQCGDDVLIRMAQCLTELFRKEDILCRWGGDEFLLYLVGAATHLDVIRQRCQILLDDLKTYSYDGRSIPVTLSIGGTVIGTWSFNEAFREADAALYQVKRQGRNGVCIFSEHEGRRIE